MKLFRNIIFLALLSGVCTGILLSVAHEIFTVPLILKSEVYEQPEPVAQQSTAHAHDANGQRDTDSHEGHHEHSPASWTPEDGFSRTSFTTLADVLAAIGFGILLVTASEMAGGIRSSRQGLVWGLAGAAVFVLAPSLGLPPELPGMPVAPLEARQTWWIVTALCTAAGLGLIAFRRRPATLVIAIILLVIPHLLAVPAAATHETAVPLELLRSFQMTSIIVAVAFWLVLGVMIAQIRRRLFAPVSSQFRTA